VIVSYDDGLVTGTRVVDRPERTEDRVRPPEEAGSP
jgi:hypothetical protein